MTGSRLSPIPLFRGHWKSLADVTRHRAVGDWVTRFVLLAAVACFPVGLRLGWTLQAPVPILAGVSLLGGALIGSFGQINTLRLKMTDREGYDDPASKIDRDAVDESAAHLLTAAYMCGVSAAVLIIGLNVTKPAKGSSAQIIAGFWAPLAIACVAYAFVTFLIAVPRLYSAYVQVNDPSAEVNGYHRGRSITGR